MPSPTTTRGSPKLKTIRFFLVVATQANSALTGYQNLITSMMTVKKINSSLKNKAIAGQHFKNMTKTSNVTNLEQKSFTISIKSQKRKRTLFVITARGSSCLDHTVLPERFDLI